MSRGTLVSVLVAVLGFTAVSCGTNESNTADRSAAPYPYTAPSAIADATNVWTAEPGFDLLSDQGVLARGAMESEFIANATERTDDAYWGFQQALAKDDGRNVGRALSDNLKHATLVGTLHWRLMSLAPAKGGFEAFACVQLRGAAAKFPVIQSPGDVHYVTWPVGSTHSTRVVFTTEKRNGSAPAPLARPTTPPSPDASNTSRWQGPSINIFNGWRLNITNSAPADADRCNSWGYTLYPPPSDQDRQLAELGRPLGGGMHSVRIPTPPPTLPNSPGWT